MSTAEEHTMDTMDTTENFLLTGPCGSGKSHMLVGLAADSLDEGTQVHVISPADDSSRADYADLIPLLSGYAGTAEDAHLVLDLLIAELARRRETPALRPRVLLILDDANLLAHMDHVPKRPRRFVQEALAVNAAKAVALAQLAWLASEGQAHGIQVVVASQRSDTVPRDIASGLTGRILLVRTHRPSEATVELAFGPEHTAEAMEVLAVHEPQPGSGVTLCRGEIYIVTP